MEEERWALITIVGCGPGSESCITKEALSAIKQATFLVGSSHLLSLFGRKSQEMIVFDGDAEGTLDKIASNLGQKKIAVLVSGDPGISSFSKSVIKRFGVASLKVIPGISSIQVAFARLGLEWLGAKIISVHGGVPPTFSYNDLAKVDKIAVLTAGTSSIPFLIDLTQSLGCEYSVYLLEDLTLASERVRKVQRDDLSEIEVSPRSIALFIRGGER